MKGRRLGVLVGVLLGVLLTTSDPASSAPRCHVLPGQKPAKGTAAGNVVLFVPRIACTPVVHTPQPRPVGEGAGGGTGQVPFTGADLNRWALGAVLALAGGTALQLGARRRATR